MEGNAELAGDGESAGNDVSYGNSCFRNGNSLIINVFTDIVFLRSDVGGWIPFRM